MWVRHGFWIRLHQGVSVRLRAARDGHLNGKAWVQCSVRCNRCDKQKMGIGKRRCSVALSRTVSSCFISLHKCFNFSFFPERTSRTSSIGPWRSDTSGTPWKRADCGSPSTVTAKHCFHSSSLKCKIRASCKLRPSDAAKLDVCRQNSYIIKGSKTLEKWTRHSNAWVLF